VNGEKKIYSYYCGIKKYRMNQISFAEVELKALITHLVGNKYREEGLEFSQEESFLEDDTKALLLRYFLDSMKREEIFHFVHPVELEMNEVYTVVKEIFDGEVEFKDASQSLARLLYEQSMHPAIKEGNLNIARFSKVFFNEEEVEAIGIFKSETDAPFLKMKKGTNSFDIEHEYGYDIKGIDKACVIFKKFHENGYRVLILDKASKSNEARFWKDDFLKVNPVKDEYHQTNDFLGIAKKYITKELTKEFELPKTDQIDLLNRSVDFFKTNESFNQDAFNEEVFANEEIIQSFNNFNESYQEAHDLNVGENFDISPVAVKKQARVFKSVLKLDKNFHIYIHGNRDLIEQGVDDRGRKYYKIYFEEEA
jgi:hypothetical protein